MRIEFYLLRIPDPGLKSSFFVSDTSPITQALLHLENECFWHIPQKFVVHSGFYPFVHSYTPSKTLSVIFALLSHPNSPDHASASLESLSRNTLSCKSSNALCAIASGFGSHSSPVIPSLIESRRPGTLLPIAGVPIAFASVTT